MGKDTHLVNIYLKIHNKRPLTMDDLRYLAKYAPECFEKTCRNVVYNRPETKPIMEPALPKTHTPETPFQPTMGTAPLQSHEPYAQSTIGTAPLQTREYTNLPQSADAPASTDQTATPEPSEQQLIEAVLENLMKLETDYFPIADISATEVKDLLGNLYMELLFPHNDTHSFFSMPVEDTVPRFDRRA